VTNWQANVEYVRYLTNALKYLSVGRVVHFSSVAVYGATGRKGMIIREEDPLAPNDWYGVTKVLGERIWRGFHEDTGIPVTVLRPSWVIGRGSHLLDRHLLAAAKSGVLVNMLSAVPLNAVYVRDVSRAALMATSNASSGFRVYNVNGVEDERFGQLLEALRTEVPGLKVSLYLPVMAVKLLARRFGSVQFLLSGVRINAARAQEELGFVPEYDVRSFIRDLIAAPTTAAVDVW
jgi:nucleoside-diphosphate-sugar epimerase